MSFKRKRNIKLDTLSTYNVFYKETFTEDEIEDYDEVKATGVEEEEEKEMHLQKVLKGKDENIPMPVILSIENECHGFYKKTKAKKFVNYQTDVPNNYILTPADQKELYLIKHEDIPQAEGGISIKREGITLIKEYNSQAKHIEYENVDSMKLYDFDYAIKCFGEDAKYFSSVKNARFVDFVLRRGLIRFEKFGFEAYAVFKPRILLPKVKSRKNEGSTVDKLSRMYLEFRSIKECANLCAEKMKREQVRSTKILKMIREYGPLFNRHVRKKLEVRKQKKDINELFYERKKIRNRDRTDYPLNDKFYTEVIEPLGNIEEDAKSVDASTNSFVKEVFENRFDCELK